jgi:hypothetical protein
MSVDVDRAPHDLKANFPRNGVSGKFALGGQPTARSCRKRDFAGGLPPGEHEVTITALGHPQNKSTHQCHDRTHDQCDSNPDRIGPPCDAVFRNPGATT